MHLGGLFLAGIGGAWIGANGFRLLRNLAPVPLATAAMAAVAALVVAPVVGDGVRVEDEGRAFIATQHAADAARRSDLLALIRSVDGDEGRVFAGAHLGWGASDRIGYVPVYAQLLDQDVDAIGWQLRVSSLATDAESRFDETDPDQLDVFGVRWLLLPADRAPRCRRRWRPLAATTGSGT